MPFESCQEEKIKTFSEYMEIAKDHLIKTVASYKTEIGKSSVDQIQLVPEEYKSLIWWVFPSQVLPEILNVKKNVTFEVLESLSLACESD
jgi:hypothetical protein